MKIRRIMILFVGLCTLTCAGNKSKSSDNKIQDDLAIAGAVVFPDEQPVSGAKVYTIPPSESVLTNMNGEFEILRGLAPGMILVRAQFNADSGAVTMALEYGSRDRIKIKLGETITFKIHPRDSLRQNIPPDG